MYTPKCVLEVEDLLRAVKTRQQEVEQQARNDDEAKRLMSISKRLEQHIDEYDRKCAVLARFVEPTD